MEWPVVPLCKAQLKDVDPVDILEDGLYRKCNTYKSGGGYDRFPAICKKRLGIEASKQFVVQLRGCPLNCWYCYVTPSGVWGLPTLKTTDELIEAFKCSGQEIFHLMGGAPALYLEYWPEIIKKLPSWAVFHSDFILAETNEDGYDLEALRAIAQPKCLYVVDIKGTSADNFIRNTGLLHNSIQLWNNLRKLVASGVNFYITFTNPDAQKENMETSIEISFGEHILEDSFSIPIIHYEAIKQ